MSDIQYTSELVECLTSYQYVHASRRGELEGIEVNHPRFKAFVLLQGAQLLEFSLDQTPWIWLSENAEYKQGTSVRGGIPVCWPWFGNADKNPNAIQAFITAEEPPAHGFARSQKWKFQRAEESDNQVIFVLDFEAQPSVLWNGSAHLELKVVLSTNGLELALTTTARDKPLAISQALHTYFPTDDIHHTRITGYDGATYTDALDNWQNKQQAGDISFTAETDRIYFSATSPTEQAIQYLHTPSLQLTLTSNSKSAVVWNPWVEKSARLSQFANDAWQRMFCVETANVLDDFVSLQPQECFTLTMKLSRI